MQHSYSIKLFSFFILNTITYCVSYRFTHGLLHVIFIGLIILNIYNQRIEKSQRKKYIHTSVCKVDEFDGLIETRRAEFV
jgi:hypothetical protein